MDAYDGRSGDWFNRNAAKNGNDIAIGVNNVEDMVQKLEAIRDGGQIITELTIYDHGGVGGAVQFVGKQEAGEPIGSDVLEVGKLATRLGGALDKDAVVNLRGCWVARGPEGRNYVQLLANAIDRNVTASSSAVTVTPFGTLNAEFGYQYLIKNYGLVFGDRVVKSPGGNLEPAGPDAQGTRKTGSK